MCGTTSSSTETGSRSTTSNICGRHRLADVVETVLDIDQEAVARVPCRRRQIVLAGPGSGKTQVVAALLHHLTEEEGLSATDEVLVISFSRAAVAAVRRRTATSGSPRVTIRTLDALAG